MKKLLFTCVAWMMAMSCWAQADYIFQHYSVEDGLSQNTVMSILQDRKGFMWFGTWDGLNKFDGYSFTTYKSYPGDNSQMSTNRIDFIYEDQLGYIWFQTYDGRFHRFDPCKEQFYSLPEFTECTNHNMRFSNRFVEVRPGELWIVTRNGITHIVPSDKHREEPTIEEYSTSSDKRLVSNTVHFIKVDINDNVWIGTDKGLQRIAPNGDMETYRPNLTVSDNNFLSACSTETGMWFGSSKGVLWRYTHGDARFECISLDCTSGITDIEVVDKHCLLATTSADGFFAYDIQLGSAQQFCTRNTPSLQSDEFSSIFLDSYGLAWLESKQPGIVRYRYKDNSVKILRPKVDAVHSYSVQPNPIIYEDVNRRLWINPQGGGFSWYNRDLDQLEYFYNEPGSADCHFSNIIHAAFSDNKGNLWLSTYNKGLEEVVRSVSHFQIQKVSSNNSLTANEVRACLQTHDDYLFFSTKDGCTRVFTKNFRELGLLGTDGSILPNNAKRTTDMVYCMHEDKHHRLWLGTKGSGLLLLTPTYRAGENPHYSIQQFRHNAQHNTSLSNDNIYSIVEDANGRILIGTYGGGINLTEWKNGQLQFINPFNKLSNYPLDNCAKVRDLVVDNDGIIWVGTTNGLLQIEANKDGEYHIFHHKKMPNEVSSLSNNDVHSLRIDKKGQLWIGTFGGGLNKLLQKGKGKKAAKFKAYTMTDGLSSDIVLCLVEDKWGNLWMSSENAISRFDIQQETFQNFSVLNDDADTYFSESTGMSTHSGTILFGSNNGCYLFNSDHILRSDNVPTLEFTKFLLFNKEVTPNTPETPLNQSIGYSDKITLRHTQSAFSIEYAALDYQAPEDIQYAFMLEGFEKQWNYVQNQRKATYTNLPRGTYHFHVKSTNNDGVWVENDKIITLVVRPAPWETGWAYLAYLLIAIGLLYVVYYITSRFSILKSEVSVEQKVTDIKLRFFTNISHELRTPLSLIQGPVENILHNEKITPSVREQLQVVQSNTARMLRLINQILDFRKIQNKKMRLKIQQTHLYDLVCDTCANFTKEADEKNINFQITDNTNDAIVWIDRDKTDIILYNLLSNAFKFTPKGKSISVHLDQKPNFVLMKVSDEGIGISRDKRNALFERFATANEIQTISNTRGSGIGLNLVKELVDLHKGYIEVESEVDKGTTFTVLLRKGKEHFDDNSVDFIVEDPDDQETLQNMSLPHTEHLDALPSGKTLPNMLIVEDNDDMRRFLNQIFKPTFHIENASDGEQGVQIALKQAPDIIISDLMMPNKDGLQLTEDLKTNERTSHIPIILLTAKAAIESRLDALKFGADDYITKPFSPIYLEARVANVLGQRQRLQERFRKELLELKPQQIKDGISPDEAFLAKLLDTMERNMDNNALTVDDLVSEMALGRTVFFNKLKGLTGLSPVEFIREIRVKRAAQLLDSTNYNITEITYMVGMNDSRYFSKCFKGVYGMTPSEYKKSLADHPKPKA